MTQCAFVLWFSDAKNNNLADLNALLAGRHVVAVSAMSGTGGPGKRFRAIRFPHARAAVILAEGSPPGGPQQAFVLWHADGQHTNLDELNRLLSEGGKVAHLVPMSGSGQSGLDTGNASTPPYSRALAILQR